MFPFVDESPQTLGTALLSHGVKAAVAGDVLTSCGARFKSSSGGEE